MKLGIVVAEFNSQITSVMLESAIDEAKLRGAEVTLVARVPGSYETPLMVSTLMRRPDVEAVVVLGYIERGETLHGEVMGHVVHRAAIDLSLQHHKPVGLGIIGPGATVEQAGKRKDPYARAAVRAALAALAEAQRLV